jgi:HEPN domain-containing protein
LQKSKSEEMATYKKDDGFFPEDILQSSFHHYEAAKKLLNDAPGLFDSGGYILHLSIELMLKAWVLHINGEFDGTHSLQHLRQCLIESGTKLPFTKEENKVLDHLDSLNKLRYPNRKKPTEVGSEELQLAETIVQKIWQSIPHDLVTAYESIPSGSKGGRKLMRKSKNIPIDVKLITGR